MRDTSTPAGPLDGIRILDMTSVVLGPLATQVLADFGAEVTKVEAPGGDLMRGNGTSRHPGMSSIFLALNRNKRSVLLDLKIERDAAALRHLVARADVFVHNMRVSAIDRLGFGYSSVAALNPHIVYCAATGFGQDGPSADKPAFDDIIQAACGLVELGSLGRDIPSYIPTLVADKTVGLALANAIMAALLHRERKGEGQYVEVPMMETMSAFVLAEHLGEKTFSPEGVAGYQRLLKGGRRPARTRDGWISLLPYTERHWQDFFRTIGMSHVLDELRVSTSDERNNHIRRLYERLTEITPTRDTADWLALCTQFDIPATPIYSLDELMDHPHLAAVGLFEQSEHPTEGRIYQVRPVTRFEKTPLSVRRHAPSLGEHTQEVLEEAGFKYPSSSSATATE